MYVHDRPTVSHAATMLGHMMGFAGIDLDALNSLTKYPPIPTYHPLNPKGGGLIDGDPVDFGDAPVIVTEKIDGTNARIISVPELSGGYILGSREELLYAQGDIIGNPAQGIVAALKPVADRLDAMPADVVRVHYLEVYGGRTSAGARHYTGQRVVGWRLFDHGVFTDWKDRLAMPRDQIAAWREAGGQTFVGEDLLCSIADRDGLLLVPRIGTIPARSLPRTVPTVLQLLEQQTHTRCALDGEAIGIAEGVVLRTADRSVIAKIRIEDYRRTLRNRPETTPPRCKPL